MKMQQKVCRSAAVVMIAVGAWMASAGWERAVAAVDCGEPELHFPAECVKAHTEPADRDFDSGANNGCAVGAGGCQMSGGCDGEQWPTAVAGWCEAVITTTNPQRCTENYGITIVTMYYLEQVCSTQNGQCGCLWQVKNPGFPPQFVQLCQCESHGGSGYP